MMHAFKLWSYNDAQRSSTISEALSSYEYTEGHLERKCQQFEECLGLLLLRSFMHLETLQLTDMPLLIEHCCMIVTYCNRSDRVPENPKLQETLVLGYFSSVTRHTEKLNNSEILSKIQELN